MKRRAFISHLSKNGCELVREGGNHSEVNELLVKKICKDLGIENP